ncbi:hypothetical protein E3P99_03180 [Wallemia hederae]|uniref:Ubiquitin-like domain-containing protein n=1 Tax=Wallemia hederae TaxID=1540922 RepID=A0A4T0FH75_9BASI|nr:hypothetical protein E3P99_03180 [Wallemia hederae]
MRLAPSLLLCGHLCVPDQFGPRTKGPDEECEDYELLLAPDNVPAQFFRSSSIFQSGRHPLTECEEAPSTLTTMAENENSANENKVNLRVAYSQGGSEDEIQFSVKPTTKLGKIFAAFCSRTGQDPSAIRFTYAGDRLDENSTVKQYEMEEDDLIHAHVSQVGGL